MNQSPPPERIVTRRREPRIKVYSGLQVRLDPCDGREPITCLLLDFSVNGVRLQLPEYLNLLSDVRVVIAGHSYNIKIQWQKATVIGAELIDEHPTLGARIIAAAQTDSSD